MKKKQLIFSASEAFASSSAQAFGESHASSEAHASSFAQALFDYGCPPHNNECHNHEKCQITDLCGMEYCARSKCDRCKYEPFIPIASCFCPEGSLRLLVDGTKPGKCAPAKSPECLRQAKLTSKDECQVFLQHKPCICGKNEVCTTISRSCDDSCLYMNFKDCTSNPNQRIPFCVCMAGFHRLQNGECVKSSSDECQAEALISIDNSKYVKVRDPKPCQCNYCYEPPK